MVRSTFTWKPTAHSPFLVDSNPDCGPHFLTPTVTLIGGEDGEMELICSTQNPTKTQVALSLSPATTRKFPNPEPT